MNNLGKYDSVEEIKCEILRRIKEKRNIKVASINSDCYDESQFNQALNELVDAGLVNTDGNFIFVEQS